MLACATLDNFIHKEYHFDEFPIKLVDESSSTELPINEDLSFEPIVQTQEQEWEDANAWRTNITLDMWRNVI